MTSCASLSLATEDVALSLSSSSASCFRNDNLWVDVVAE